MILTITIVLDPLFTKVNISAYINAENKIIFFVISYFMGVVFQEITSLLYRKFLFKDDKLLNQVFEADNTLNYYITKMEVEKLRVLIAKKVYDDVKNDNTFIYNMCKTSVLKSEQSTRANADQVVAGLSRSLSLYFWLLAFAMLIFLFTEWKLHYLIFFITFGLIAVLLCFRYMRFIKMRYSYILRTYLYSCME